MFKKKANIPLMVILTLVLFVANTSGVTFVWEDGDFPDQNWDIISWYPPLDSGDSDATLAFTIAHGGNPDGLRAMGETIGAGPDDGAMIVQLNNQWTWDPAVGGPVVEINGGFDHQWAVGGPARIGLAVQQDGDIYLHVLHPQAADTAWTTFYSSMLTAGDFAPIDPADTGQPDFSATGSLMTFGFATGQFAVFAGGYNSFYQYVDNVLFVVTAGPVSAVGPELLAVLQAPVIHPNPFNPRTEITFEMPAAGFASLRIFDLSGRLVRMLEARRFAKGSQSVTWTGDNDAGHGAASGVYLAVLETAGVRVSQRLTLAR